MAKIFRYLLNKQAIGFVGIFLFAMGLILYSVGAYRLVIEWPELNSDSAESTLSQFIETVQPVIKMTVKDIEAEVSSKELLESRYYLPVDGSFAKVSEFLDLRTCGKSTPNPYSGDQGIKLQSVKSGLCSGSVDLEILKTPPYLVPGGGSWIEMLRSMGLFKVTEYELSNTWIKYFHILERRDLKFRCQTKIQCLLQELDLFNWEDLENGAPVVETEHNVIVMTAAVTHATPYSVYKKTDWDRFYSGSPILLSGWSSASCFSSKESLCYQENLVVKNRLLLTRNFGIGITFVGLFVLILSLMSSKKLEAQQSKQDRVLVFQTLTHELRHPVTSLKLSIEVLREKFESMDEESQIEFLRMVGELSRLDRILEASKQYLQTESDIGSPFLFQWKNMASLKEVLEIACEQYIDRIEVQWVGQDGPGEVDLYWVMFCIHNLIKNALIHGQSPVIVIGKILDKGTWQIVVQDAGPGSSVDWRVMIQPFGKSPNSQGMGLGLSMVNRISKLMKGKLEMKTRPSQFILHLRRKHEK